MKVLFSSGSEKPEDWLPLLKSALPKDEFVLEGGCDVALVANPPAGVLDRLVEHGGSYDGGV